MFRKAILRIIKVRFEHLAARQGSSPTFIACFFVAFKLRWYESE